MILDSEFGYRKNDIDKNGLSIIKYFCFVLDTVPYTLWGIKP